MHSYLPRHQVVLFTGHAILHGTLDFVMNNILVLHMILEIFNIAAPVLNGTNSETVGFLFLQVIYLLLHIGILSQIIWGIESYLYDKHLQYIRNSFYKGFDVLFLKQEQQGILINLNPLDSLIEIRELVLEQIKLYADSFSILIKVTAVTILIYIKHNSQYKTAILALPLIYALIVLLAHSLVIHNKKLESSAKNQILNYLILLLLIAIFPSLCKLGIVIILLYPIIIQDLTFEKWYLYNNNHRKLSYLSKELISKALSSSTYVLSRPRYSITIRQYFQLSDTNMTDFRIINALNSLNLVPELLKIHPDVLSIGLDDSKLSNKIAIQISFLRAYHLKFKKMTYDSNKISNSHADCINRISEKLGMSLVCMQDTIKE